MGTKINCILVDFETPKSWDFFEGLSKEENWEIIKSISNRKQKGISNIERILKYIFFPFKVFLRKKKYSKIVAWQQFYGLFLCFYLRFFHCKKGPKIVILTFIYKQKRGIKGRIYKRFVKYSLGCKFLKKLVVLSNYEIDFYSNLFSISKDKFSFCHIGDDSNKIFDIQKGDYFLSAGRSNRDYDFLVNYFSKHPEIKLVIISDKYRKEGLSSNISILSNCFNEDYERMLASCYAVIISLCEEPISSGQLVALRALKYEKPIIATNNPGIIDYVLDNQNGYVIEKKEDALDRAIINLKNEDIYERISNSKIKFSNIEYGKQVNKLF